MLVEQCQVYERAHISDFSTLAMKCNPASKIKAAGLG
jgi:hypothetical protein